MSTLYYSGTSGILLPYKNKSFYPEHLQDKSRLTVYSLLFNSLEVNSSFYKIPRAETIRRWSEETADGFRFTFKLWRGITHNGGLDFDPNDVYRFMTTINAIGEKKGCLLIQLPPSVRFDLFPRLSQLLELITAAASSRGWFLCVEFRHASWYREETRTLLGSYNATWVLHDKNKGGMMLEQPDRPFVYLRFHGPEGDYNGSYDDSFLYEYSSYIKEWLGQGKHVFAYFNNTIGEAIANLNTLRAYVNKKP